MLAWLSVWSKVQPCTWHSWCHCLSLSLASLKSRLIWPFWYRLTQVVPEKGPLNVCVRACVRACVYYGVKTFPHSVWMPMGSNCHPGDECMRTEDWVSLGMWYTMLIGSVCNSGARRKHKGFAWDWQDGMVLKRISCFGRLSFRMSHWWKLTGYWLTQV